MSRSQFKVSRRIGENIWPHKKVTSKQRAILLKLNQKVNRKQSDFSKQLQHSTKLSMFYGNMPIHKIQHNRISSYLDKQSSLLLLLETRLDVLLVRANFCSTMSAARQYITHRKVMVNSHVVDLPSCHINIGDIVCISVQYLESTKDIMKPNFLHKRIDQIKAQHLEINYKLLSVVLLYEPTRIQFPYQIELDLI